MKTLRDIALLFQRMLVQLLRNPVWLVVGFSTPILYLALFTPLLRTLAGQPSAVVLDEFLPGILSLLAFSTGVSAGFSTIFELKGGVIERLRVTPASRARSHPASVCPARVSTPPGCAMIGKMCPGCRKSSGLALGATAVRTVCARS